MAVCVSVVILASRSRCSCGLENTLRDHVDNVRFFLRAERVRSVGGGGNVGSVAASRICIIEEIWLVLVDEEER